VSLSIDRKRPIVIEHFFQPSVGLSVCLVYCGEMDFQIWVRFGMIGRMGLGVRQVVGFGHGSMGGDNFAGKCGAPHCNQ